MCETCYRYELRDSSHSFLRILSSAAYEAFARHAGNATVKKELRSFGDHDVLNRLQPLDLHGRIAWREGKLVGYGGFSDLYKGRYWDDECGAVNVAIKRMRFHATSDCKLVRAVYRALEIWY